jgi:hypothetical protein
VGIVIEASEKDAYADLDAFAAAFTADTVDLSNWESQTKVGYRSLAGDQLEMSYNGDHRVNETVIDYDAWALYDAPEASAQLQSGVVELRHRGESLTLDFSVDPNRPMLPMRVIG